MKDSVLMIKQLLRVFELFYENVVVKEIEPKFHVWASQVTVDLKQKANWILWRDQFGNWGYTHGDEEGNFYTSEWHEFLKKLIPKLSANFIDSLLQEEMDYTIDQYDED